MDTNGTFSLEVKKGDVLVFTSVGYQARELTIDNQTTLHVTLNQDLNILEEVVLTGYSTQVKKDITDAVSVLDVKELTKVEALTTVIEK